MTEAPNKVIATRDNAIQESQMNSSAVPNGNDSDFAVTPKVIDHFDLADIPQEVINHILIGMIFIF